MISWGLYFFSSALYMSPFEDLQLLDVVEEHEQCGGVRCEGCERGQAPLPSRRMGRGGERGDGAWNRIGAWVQGSVHWLDVVWRHGLLLDLAQLRELVSPEWETEQRPRERLLHAATGDRVGGLGTLPWAMWGTMKGLH